MEECDDGVWVVHDERAARGVAGGEKFRDSIINHKEG
jgi:hypothetical protein